ncbi:MAG: hypothetical protein V3R77_01335 [Candidatus Binatia bacterium]
MILRMNDVLQNDFARRVCTAAIVIAVGSDGASNLAEAQPLNGGPERPVNQFFVGAQDYAAIAPLGSSGYVVVWESQDQDGNGEGIYGRLLDSSGVPTGTEFRVNTTTLGSQDTAAVAATASGDFVVVWESFGQDGNADGVFGQRFSSTGTPIGTEFPVNSTTAASQDDPDVTCDGAGNFVVVWEAGGAQDGSNTGVFGQRFSSTAIPIGTEFQANTTTVGSQSDATIGIDGSGSFVVIWSSTTGDGDGTGMFGQRFSAAAAKVGTEFHINTYTTGSQDEADVAVHSDGSFVALWESFGQDGFSNGVYGQRYASSGAKAGAEFQVNVYTTYSQDDVAVQATPDGGFIVAWESLWEDGDEAGVFAQRYDVTGAAVGGNFQVNVDISPDQEDPAIAVSPAGDFVVAYENFEFDGSYGAVTARRFTTEPLNSSTTTTTIKPFGGACDVVPAAGCATAEPGRSSLQFTVKGGSRDKLKWKFNKGAATTLAEFLDPVGSPAATYSACFYDAGGKIVEGVALAQGMCSGKPCWKASGTKGFKYKDKLAKAGGVTGMKLKTGSEGRTQVQVRGKGGSLGLPLGPYSLPLTAQLIADNGIVTNCWQNVFSATTKNTLTGLKAKGP